MVGFSPVTIVALLVFAIPAVRPASNQDDKIIFKSYDNDMPWPLLDFGDITLSLTHGVHCIEVMRYNGSGEFHHLHKAHCIGIARQILEFFESTPNYTVPEILCQDFRSIAFPGGRVRRGSWGGWRGWGRKKRSISLIKPRRHSINRQQDDYYSTLATRNFEDLLVKEQQGALLTTNEIIYLEGARSPQFIHMAALGLYCKYEGYIGVVQDIITEHLTLDENQSI